MEKKERKTLTQAELAEKATKDITELAMHETIKVVTTGLNGCLPVDFTVTKAMTGWIYVMPNGNAVFIPEK